MAPRNLWFRLPLYARVLALMVALLLACVQAHAAIVIDDFGGSRLGTRSVSYDNAGGTSPMPTFTESTLDGYFDLNSSGNSITSVHLTYSVPAPFDITEGGANKQFLLEFASATRIPSQIAATCFQIFITIYTTTGTLQYGSGIAAFNTINNMALDWSQFSGSGSTSSVTGVDIDVTTGGNLFECQLHIRRIYASPSIGGVPTPAAPSFSAVTSSPTGNTTIDFNLSFYSNFGVAAVTGLTASDITVSGTAGATTAVVTGSLANYNVAVSGMTTDGTVIVSIAPAAVVDGYAQTNTSGDTSPAVTYWRPPVFTNGPPPSSATIGSAYTFDYTTSGAGTITYAVAAGALPGGLSLSSGGAITGTPTALGTFAGTTRATNAAYTDQPFSITVVCPTLSVQPATLATAPVMYVPYPQTFTTSASNGFAGPYSYSVSSGSLPPGLTLATDGTLSGTPNTLGTYTFTVTTALAAGCSGSQSYTVTVQPPVIAVTPTTLSNGTRATAYNATFGATGSPFPFTFSVSAGSLPTGLMLATDGTLSGTPTTPGPYNFSVTASDGTFSGSRSYSVTINKTSSTTTLVPAPASSVFGQPVTLNANVSGTSGPPTGSVTFLDGVTSLGTVAVDINGNAALASSALAIGSHTLTAAYGGDGNFVASTSSSANVDVGKAATTTTLSSSANPINATFPLTITASVAAVAPASGIPSGKVDFFDGANAIGSVNLNASGSASITTSVLNVATHPLTATYAGDGNFNGSTSAVLNQSVTPPPIVIAPATLPSATYGLAYSVQLSATGTSQPFTFTVTAGSLPGGLSLASNGLLSGSPTGHGSTSFTVTASDGTYSGTRDYTLLITDAATSITLTANPTSAMVGQTVALSAKVTSNALGGSAPGGYVTFKESGATIGHSALDSSGATSFTTDALSAGTHSFTADYLGDSTSGASSSPSVAVVVAANVTSLTLAAAPNPSLVAQAVTLTATLAGAVNGTGTVDFLAGGTTIAGCAALAVNAAKAVCTTSALSAGTHTLTAAYSGDAANAGSTSNAVTQQVVSQLALPVYRFDTPTYRFYTSSESERTAASTFASWIPRGVAFYAYGSAVAGTLPVYRFNSGSEHFYTISEVEKAFIAGVFRTWTYEGVAFYAYADGSAQTTPVYRFNAGPFHVFAVSDAEKTLLQSQHPGWTLEGVAFHGRTAP
ncbi:MAG TPA: Ig-like domain repeat protein [Casimicrobiaceae bacterium]|nr:Ig-like domain repeat protein [Casimicrobiaceae bacterium]